MQYMEYILVVDCWKSEKIILFVLLLENEFTKEQLRV